MKKINLKNLSLDEVLTKDELKKIVGGNGSGCQNWYCYCPSHGGWTAVTCSTDEVDNMFIAVTETCGYFACGLI